jgi:23S rRNA U2552 (ribose-2'-O)-methylase RlmE/FtsJ
MMQNIGNELHGCTGAFNVTEEVGYQPRILDLCMAPGGFLLAAMQCNPDAIATAYSLPFEAGGHKVLLPENENIKIAMLDITMLAADMDANDIPEGHPDSANFLPKQFSDSREFDIVLCDGQVLRTHPRADYRALTEARRLSVTQLALGLGHLRPGGTMVVLLHGVEGLITLELLHMFTQFSSIQLIKPPRAHAKRSSFYMAATNVQVEHPEALKAVESWKQLWKVATFGSEEEYKQLVHKGSSWAEGIVNDFGPALLQLGRPIWAIQARALANAPFIKGSPAAPHSSRQWRRE